MLKQSIAVVAGFVIWSVLWLGYGMILRGVAFLPADETAPVVGITPLLVLLLGSIVVSLIAGYTAALISRRTSYGILILGLALLATGLFVQLQYWHLMPLWYHVLFLGLLMPACFAGSRLRSGSQ